MKCIKFSTVYRPPRGDHTKCLTILTEILSRRENFKKEIFLLGDFHVDYLKRTDINFKRFQNFFKTFGLTQLIKGVTRPAKTSSSITTIFLSNHFTVDCIKEKPRENKKNNCS